MGYNSSRTKIQQTLTGRTSGTQVTPDSHQAMAEDVLNYIQEVENISLSGLEGIAYTDTTPVQPDKANCAYISAVPSNTTYTYKNFADENGDVVSITATTDPLFVILFWNKKYWSYLATTSAPHFHISAELTDSNDEVPSSKAVSDALQDIYKQLQTADQTLQEKVDSLEKETNSVKANSENNKASIDRFEKIPLARLSMEYECGILAPNNTVDASLAYKTYKTYTFDVSSYAGQDITITARGLAAANYNWPLYIIVHEDNTTSVVPNVVGKTITDYKVTLPDDAKYLRMAAIANILITASSGNLILPSEYTTIEEKKSRLKSIMKLPPSGKYAIIEDSSINLLLNTTFTEGKYLNMNTGLEEVLSVYSYSDYIDVSRISTFQQYLVSNNGGCFYDKDKNFISGYGISDYGLTSGKIANFIVEVPANAKYVRINVAIANRNDGTAYAIDYNLSPSKVKYPWLEIAAPKILFAVDTAPGHMANDGTIDTSAPVGTITKYDVTSVKSVLISLSGSLTKGANPKWCTIWVVDKNNSPILMLPVDTTGNILKDYPLTIPKNGVQLWVQSNSPKVYISSEIVSVIEYIQKNIDDLKNSEISITNQWTGKKIVWLGTSIPYGQGTDGFASAPTTYPMQIGKKLGATVVNVARPGMAIETTANFKRKSWGSLSLTIAELQSEGAETTPYQSYENAMLGQNADLYVFDCEPNNSNWDLTDLENFSVHNWAYNDSSSFESHRNSYVGALLFLLDKLWTEKPSAKVVFISEYVGNNLDNRYQGLEASKAVAEKLRIPLIDVADKLYYTALNKSLYLNSDNVHPKQVTHDRIANILASELLSIG